MESKVNSLVVASYIFYAHWDYRFLLLIVFGTLQTYTIGRFLFHAKNYKSARLFLFLSLSLNILVLFVFKYFNFFIEMLNGVANLAGEHQKISTLNIVLPVGISFYIFQTLIFIIDIYKKISKNFRRF